MGAGSLKGERMSAGPPAHQVDTRPGQIAKWKAQPLERRRRCRAQYGARPHGPFILVLQNPIDLPMISFMISVVPP